MKRIITVFMVFAMLLSAFAVTAGAEQTCQEVTIPRFASMPTFDGVISAEEWGEPTVHVVVDGAATEDDNEVGRNDEYGLINTFYWFLFEDSFVEKNFYYDLWMRWDEEYFYIAAKVNDPDPFSQSELWTGDTFQFNVDVKGPSQMALKQKPEFDYKTDSFPVMLTTPWTSQAVFSCLASFYKRKEPILWRARGDWNIVKEVGGYIGITTTDNGDGMTCTNVFEIAVPWSVVAAESVQQTSLNEAFVPAEGDVYGITTLVNYTDSNTTYGWLQWGHGIGYVSEKVSQPRGTRGGSQAMILGNDIITPAADYVTATVTTETSLVVEKPLTRPVSTTESSVANEMAEKITVDKSKGPVDTDGTDFDGSIIMVAAVCVVIIASVAVIIIVRKKKPDK